mmetsp:Transcript_35677/g.57747  ORF Transcript_35677/g.57747 Transcript_35677/m.57747 type:complete len:133 (+) Transcript_35677:433-831(+)
MDFCRRQQSNITNGKNLCDIYTKYARTKVHLMESWASHKELRPFISSFKAISKGYLRNFAFDSWFSLRGLQAAVVERVGHTRLRFHLYTSQEMQIRRFLHATKVTYFHAFRKRTEFCPDTSEDIYYLRNQKM